MNGTIGIDDPRVFLLSSDGERIWWDIKERKMITAATAYIAYGCPDWGETQESGVWKRNQLCTFCPFPNAVLGFREAFYEGKPVPSEDHIQLFKAVLAKIAPANKKLHTVMIFNGGSFLAMDNATQENVVQEIANHPSLQRLVIESRAELVNEAALKRITDILFPHKELTIRIGVETQNDDLRLKILKKGHSRRQLKEAMEVMKRAGAMNGGYVLLKPAPFLDADLAMEEAARTIDWVLGTGTDDLGMDEVYFSSTNVGIDTPLTEIWRRGDFQPATLWMVYKVLRDAAQTHPYQVHLLPFKDEPELLAVPSNHVPRGIPQNLAGAAGCDLEFHNMFDLYRQTMDAEKLVPPECSCKPDFI